MKKMTQANADMQKLAELIDQAGIAMLTTQDRSGELRSRPMMPLEMDEQGSLWFATRADAVDKASTHKPLNLSFSKAEDGLFIALSGKATLVDDRQKIEDLWNPMMRPWFKDAQDPNLVLLRVDIEGGEYWNSSNFAMVRFAGHVISAIAGREVGLGENATVTNPAA